MQKSRALLTAWFVVIAGLTAAIVVFFLNARSPQTEPVPDEAVKPAPPPKPATPPKSGGRGPRGSSGTAPTQRTTPARPAEILGKVHASGGAPVAGAKVAVFPPSRGGLPQVAPDAAELRLVNGVMDLDVEDYDLPRPLSAWVGDAADADAPADMPEVASTLSRDDGTFTLTLPAGAGSGPFRLTATKPDVGSATAADVRAGQTLDLALGAATGISGTVVTEVDQVPVPAARVTLDSGGQRFSAVTTPEGKFRLDGVTPGFYDLSVAARGRTPLFQKTFRVSSADEPPYTLRMPRGTTLRVKATVASAEMLAGAPRPAIPSGAPVPDATIVCYLSDPCAYVIGKTNAEGVAEFPGMPAGQWSVNGRAKGFVAEGDEIAVVRATELLQEESFTFEPAVDTPIQVVDDDGRPISGMRFFTLNSNSSYDSVHSEEVGVSDHDGKFSFAFEFDGKREAVFGFKEGYAFVYAMPENYDDGTPLRLVAKPAITVHGTVRSEAGDPIPDAAVVLTVAPTSPEAFMDQTLELRAGKDGTYRFTYLPRSESVSIAATAPDGIADDEHDLELDDGRNDYTVDFTIDLDVPAPAMTSPSPLPHRPSPPKTDGRDR